MSKIRVLPDSLANKIAAGEVVERPASIVKELLENAIDAGASRIEIAVEAGGRRLIRLSDDGEGMTRDDALLAFERHATSKIRAPEDLDAILTLGFRGEALASIASVTKVRMRTQTANDLAGTEIDIAGGRLINVKETAFTRGTEMEIRDLFFNVPARRKFLKSEATESFHIANLVTHYALAYPALAFTLVNNGRESIRLTPAADLRERAYQLFGEEFIGDLIEVEGEAGELRVKGYVSSPSSARTTRDNQYFFVNRRYVRDKLLGRALSEGFRAMIPSGTYPSAMLFVELPPQDVDVNVHPAKTEVRFVRAAIVLDTVREAVGAAINRTKAAATPMHERPMHERRMEIQAGPSQAAELTQEREEQREQESGRFPSPATPRPPVRPQEQPGVLRLPSFSNAPSANAPSDFASQTVVESANEGALSTPAPAPAPAAAPAAETAAPPEVRSYGQRLGCLGGRAAGEGASSQLKAAANLTLLADEINALGQLHNSFIIAADRAGLLLIDQHVAHERILFEQHWRALRQRRLEVQRLLLPETLDLTPAQAASFDQIIPELEENGFELGRLSGRTIAVKAVPAMLGAGAAQALLVELLDAIEEERRGLSLDELRAEIAASLACRAAVKINMPLAAEKIRYLIDELLKMENPATCPHGRPIILRITMREIERSFQRS